MTASKGSYERFFRCVYEGLSALSDICSPPLLHSVTETNNKTTIITVPAPPPQWSDTKWRVIARAVYQRPPEILHPICQQRNGVGYVIIPLPWGKQEFCTSLSRGGCGSFHHPWQYHNLFPPPHIFPQGLVREISFGAEVPDSGQDFPKCWPFSPKTLDS